MKAQALSVGEMEILADFRFDWHENGNYTQHHCERFIQRDDGKRRNSLAKRDFEFAPKQTG